MTHSTPLRPTVLKKQKNDRDSNLGVNLTILDKKFLRKGTISVSLISKTMYDVPEPTDQK